MSNYVLIFLIKNKYPDGKSMQIMMTGFLGKTKARSFMGELWKLMVEAQENFHGIPTCKTVCRKYKFPL